MKRCSKCGELKNVESFYTDKRYKDGRYPSCKECGKRWRTVNAEKRAEYKKRYRATNHEKTREGQKRYRAAHKEKIKETNRAWHATNRERVKETHQKWKEANAKHIREYGRRASLKSTYGITPEQYQAILISQGGGCAICGTPENKGNKRRHKALAVDHDHNTGAVRGILCHACNLAVGILGDNVELLKKATDYLQQWSTKQPPI